MTSQVRIAEKRHRRRLWPLLGAVLAVTLAAIAYLVAPEVIRITKEVLPRFSTAGMSQQTVRILFSAIIFVVFLGISVVIVALFAPKKALNVKDSDLVKQREAMQRERKMDRVRQRKLNRAYREQLTRK